MREICKNCAGYQEEEKSAGLLSACVTDELYADEDCQIIKDDVNDIVTDFMLDRIAKCPYFKEIRI